MENFRYVICSFHLIDEENGMTDRKRENGHGYSYLPGFDTAVAARRKAAKGILEWANAHLPEHRADADEPFEQVESVGFSAVRYNFAAEPNECLGFACLMPSYICDVCKFSKENREIEDLSFFLVRFGINRTLSTVLKPVFQSRYDDQYDWYLPAPMGRGRRAHI